MYSSDEIYDAALRKVKNEMAGKILETQVSGHIMASICRVRTTIYLQFLVTSGVKIKLFTI